MADPVVYLFPLRESAQYRDHLILERTISKIAPCNVVFYTESKWLNHYLLSGIMSDMDIDLEHFDIMFGMLMRTAKIDNVEPLLRSLSVAHMAIRSGSVESAGVIDINEYSEEHAKFYSNIANSRIATFQESIGKAAFEQLSEQALGIAEALASENEILAISVAASISKVIGSKDANDIVAILNSKLSARVSSILAGNGVKTAIIEGLPGEMPSASQIKNDAISYVGKALREGKKPEVSAEIVRYTLLNVVEVTLDRESFLRELGDIYNTKDLARGKGVYERLTGAISNNAEALIKEVRGKAMPEEPKKKIR